MSTLPRNMNLKAFDPHRADFTCRHESDVNPPVTEEGEALFQRGMAVTSYDLLPDKRDYTKAAELWKQAAALGHWKAAMNLAGLYESGLGVPQDSEQAVLIVEGLMKQGVPAAFDKMGTYHQSGIGVKGDTSRAYAFWQLAADMGSSAAQAYLGYKLQGTYDNPGQGFWGNREVALKMLECGYAQGNGDAAYTLALTITGDDPSLGEDNARALRIYHEGVKLGCKDCARDLSVSFRLAEPLTGNTIDRARADRYRVLRGALELNPDLRLPNLDKVLPLPPAPLPFWDGKRETLIDAAKAVIVKQPTPATPGANRTGRSHIPQGYVLTGNATLPPDENAYDNQGRPWSLKAKQHAHFTGYWLPQIDVVRSDWQLDWNAAQVPLHFKRSVAHESRWTVNIKRDGYVWSKSFQDEQEGGEYACLAGRQGMARCDVHGTPPDGPAGTYASRDRQDNWGFWRLSLARPQRQSILEGANIVEVDNLGACFLRRSVRGRRCL